MAEKGENAGTAQLVQCKNRKLETTCQEANE